MDPKEPPSIELKLISCKDLKAFNFFQKLTIYAVVSISSYDPKRELKEKQKQRQRTKTDRETDGDGGNPEWNHEARFDLGWVTPLLIEGSKDLFFRFEFRHDGVLLGDKLIGECHVPVTDLVRDSAAVADVARFVSYEVRSGEGKPNGIFNFSYKLKGIGIGIGNMNSYHSSQILGGRISGYPVVDPEDCDPSYSLVQYPPPPTEIGSACCYVTVAPPVPSTGECDCNYPPPFPPPVPSFGECDHNYPPPSLPRHPPLPPYPYPPPPPPVAHEVRYYPAIGPGAHYPWPASGPSFEHRW